LATERNEATDEELAVAARDGSQAAFGTLVERYERPVFSLIVRIVRRGEVAEELAQEAFIRAWKALPRFDPKRKFSSWLFKIAHNASLDSLRRGRDSQLSIDEPASPGDDAPRQLPADPKAEDPLERTTFRAAGRALEEALGELRREYREILVLRFSEGLSYDEIAEVTGSPLGTVKVQIFRARKELAKKMQAMGWDPKDLGS